MTEIESPQVRTPALTIPQPQRTGAQAPLSVVPAPRVEVRPHRTGAGYSVGAEEPDGNFTEWRARVLAAFGTTEESIADALLSQIAAVLHADETGQLDPETANLALALLHRLAPRNEVEAMLCVQMVVAHFAGLDASRRALHAKQTTAGRQAYLSLARKLMGLFVTQVDALHRGRGHGVVQKVVVERVNVEAGGQAVVGALAGGGAGGGGGGG